MAKKCQTQECLWCFKGHEVPEGGTCPGCGAKLVEIDEHDDAIGYWDVPDQGARIAKQAPRVVVRGAS